jgi:hypothetical protein
LAKDNNITSLPVLLNNNKQIVGMNKIKQHLSSLVSEKNQTQKKGKNSPVPESSDIQQMWWNEIVESRDNDESMMGNGAKDNIKSQISRATELTKKRQISTGKNPNVQVRNGSTTRQQIKNIKNQQNQQNRQNHQQDNSDDNNGNMNDINNRKQNVSRRENIEISPADLTRELHHTDKETAQDDELMAQFWDNNTETVL